LKEEKVTEYYDLVKGPQGDFPPVTAGGETYNTKWEDEARAAAEEKRDALDASGSLEANAPIAGTPFVAEHWFDFRDGEVTVDPAIETSDS
jgi:hypothetical protein